MLLEEALKLYPILNYFSYSHLPDHLIEISKPFSDLALDLVVKYDKPNKEVEMFLRKLLEAKDCAVRAAL